MALPTTPVRAMGAMAAVAAAPAESPAAELFAAPAAAAAATVATFGSHAGELLLGVSQTIPFIAPVAFLFAAVLKSADTAVTLKADAHAFSRVVESVEALCHEVALGGAFTGEAFMASENAVNDLRAALEDGLAHCQKLQNQPFVSGLLFSGRDSQRFSEIEDGMYAAMTLLTAATAVSTNRLVKEQYSQGKKLEAKLEELGGADAVANDPALQAQAQSFLEASDQLLLSSVQKVGAEG
jgi:hypothetical protein